MKKTVVVLGLVAVLVLGVAYAFAQGPGPGPGDRPCSGYERWSSLTPEQQTKIQELRQRFHDETAQLRETIHTKRLELRSLWTNPQADSKAILEKEKELSGLQDQMRDHAVQFKLEARQFLTPEQLSQFGPGWGMGRGFGGGRMWGGGYGRGRGGFGPGRGCY